ncbi:hypothetical protein [Cribrihabitans neustonicus]|uniref:hypothetical protein n=1 Tax=Cribrihabitans neustonicus TaxID=1429085 RepID=UPI003B59E165
MIYPIVLASGGAGETATQAEGLPAHFAAGPGIESRFQAHLSALAATRCAAPVVITGTGCRLAAAAQAAAVQGAAAAGPELLLEPGASKPAAAAAVAALRFQDRPEALLLFTPASHLFGDAGALDKLLLEAVPAAAQGRIVAFGAAPGSAALGFGVLDCRSARPGRSPQPAVLLPSGCKLTEAGPGALHNTGIYLLRAGTLLAVLKRCAPRILQAAKAALAGARRSCGALQLGTAGWQRARPSSFEDAIASRAGSLVALASGPAADVFAHWEADRCAPSFAAPAAPAAAECTVATLASAPWPGAGTPGNADAPPPLSLAAAGGQQVTGGTGRYPAPELQLSGPGDWERAVRVKRLELLPGERAHVPAGTGPGHLAVLQGCALLSGRGRSRLLWEDQSAVVPAGGLEIENPAGAPLHAVLVEVGPDRTPGLAPAEVRPDPAAAIISLRFRGGEEKAARPRPC